MVITPVVASMISAGASSASGLASTLLTNHAQRKENERSREYNLKLAQMQNQWNVEQWQRENDYNSPTAQLQRLKAAGLNPDMMYGGSGISNTAASSPSMTAGAPASPANLVGMPNSVSDYLDAQLKQAQIDNINADTEKKGAETSVLSSDAKFRDAWNQGQINLQNIQIEVAASARDLNNANAEYLRGKLLEIQPMIANLNASTKQIYNAITIENKRLDMDKALNDAKIREIASNVGVNIEVAKRYREELEKVLRNMDDQHNINVSRLTGINTENDILEFNKDVVKFKSEVLTAKKRDLSTAQQFIRLNEEYFKALISTM